MKIRTVQQHRVLILMLLHIFLAFALLMIAGILSLRFVPKRWNSVDIKVGPRGFQLIAEESPNDTQ